jgi:hypothetical protein
MSCPRQIGPKVKEVSRNIQFFMGASYVADAGKIPSSITRLEQSRWFHDGSPKANDRELWALLAA